MRSLADGVAAGAQNGADGALAHGRDHDDAAAVISGIDVAVNVLRPIAALVVLFALVRLAQWRREARARAGYRTYAGADEYSSRGSMGVPLCGCMGRPSVCLMGCCAPCCLAGMSMAESQGRSWTLWDWMFPSQFATRQAIRQELNLPRGNCEATCDAAEVVFCAPCVACQHHTYYCNKYERGDFDAPIEASTALLQAPAPAECFPAHGAEDAGALPPAPVRDAAWKGGV